MLLSEACESFREFKKEDSHHDEYVSFFINLFLKMISLDFFFDIIFLFYLILCKVSSMDVQIRR